jgi:predicted  nucleic acid-binding Zn-ribbon protein
VSIFPTNSLEGYSIDHANRFMMQRTEEVLANRTLAVAIVQSDVAEMRSQVLGAAEVVERLAYAQAQNRQNIHELGETADYLEREHHERAAEVAENRFRLDQLEQALEREGAALDREGAALERNGAALERQSRELASLHKDLADLIERKRKHAALPSGICASCISGIRNYMNRVGNAVSGFVNWVHALLSKTWKKWSC